MYDKAIRTLMRDCDRGLGYSQIMLSKWLIDMAEQMFQGKTHLAVLGSAAVLFSLRGAPMLPRGLSG